MSSAPSYSMRTESKLEMSVQAIKYCSTSRGANCKPIISDSPNILAAVYDNFISSHELTSFARGLEQLFNCHTWACRDALNLSNL